MVRVTQEERQASNARIIEEAARLFREQGIEATSVADVMSAAGLTHGGFYRHFKSKDDLVCAAIEKAFQGIAVSLERKIDQQGAIEAVENYVKQYLSKRHVEMTGKGCPIAALVVEVGRGPKVCKQALEKGTDRIADLIARSFTGDPRQAHTKAMGLLSTLAGTIVMARSMQSTADVKKLLQVGHENAVKIIGQ